MESRNLVSISPFFIYVLAFFCARDEKADR